jgi:hypothetical protein
VVGSSAAYHASMDGHETSRMELELANALSISGTCAYDLFVIAAGRSAQLDQKMSILKVYDIAEEHLTKAIDMFSQWKLKTMAEDGDMGSGSIDLYNGATKSLSLLRKARKRVDAGEDAVLHEEYEDDEPEEDLLPEEDENKKKKTKTKLLRKKKRKL